MAGDVLDKPILETERLVFHPFTADDFGVLAGLHSDPEVQRHLGGMWTDEIIQHRLDIYVSDQAELGYSKWKAYLRDGTFVGRAGVTVDRQIIEPELGYSFVRAAWGQGLASEAAQGIVDWMFEETPVSGLIGFATVGNAASRRVLEKVGMMFLDERELHGELCAYYRLERPA
jgi:ribosomal-protein-alanine N-acetyltransferase